MSLLSALTVYNVNSNKLRIGNERDGGYIVNDIIVNNTNKLISVGIGGEDQFELEWANKYPNTHIEAYDGTYPCNNLCHKFPDRINKNIFYVHHNVGYKEKQIPLNTVVDGKKRVLLKVDTEGGEYAMFDNVFFKDDSITGLILEVHDLHEPANQEKLANLILNNFSNLLLFHIHGNAWGGTFNLQLMPNKPHSITIPNFPHVAELCFVNKSLVTEYSRETSEFPVPGLDTSNKHDAPDIDLYWVNSI